MQLRPCHAPILESGGTTLWFSDVSQLLGFKGDDRLVSIMDSLTCLSVMVNVLDTETDRVLEILDFVNELTISAKELHLYINDPILDFAQFHDVNINYNVAISSQGTIIQI